MDDLVTQWSDLSVKIKSLPLMARRASKAARRGKPGLVFDLQL
jgi:hypothetical protein